MVGRFVALQRLFPSSKMNLTRSGKSIVKSRALSCSRAQLDHIEATTFQLQGIKIQRDMN
jgi:hypothetical protein